MKAKHHQRLNLGFYKQLNTSFPELSR